MKTKFNSRDKTSSLSLDSGYPTKKSKPVNNEISMDSYSSDSDTEESLSVEEEYLTEKPYKFFIDQNKRGKIDHTIHRPTEQNSNFNKSSLAVGFNYVVNVPIIASEEKNSVKIQKMIETQSFGKTNLESESQTKTRVSLVIGVNKKKSVFKEKNQILDNELNTPINSSYPLARIGYFWKPQWNLIDPNGYRLKLCEIKKMPKKGKLPDIIKKHFPSLIKERKTNKIYIYGKWLSEKPALKLLGENIFAELFKKAQSITVSFTNNKDLFNLIIEKKGHSGKVKHLGLGTLRSWFRKTETNKQDLETHLLIEEEKPALRMIPYRELRETLKDSKECLGFLNNHQQNGKPTYLMFFDSSIKSLRTLDGMGILSCYDNIILKYNRKYKKYPEVISTGYRIDSETYPLDALGIKYDMDVRTKSNKHNQNSIYPPEPNFGILTIPNAKLESFCDGTKDYSSPMESLTLIKNIIKNRKLDGSLGSVFKGKSAIEIEVRARMLLKSKDGERKKFQAEKVNFRGEYLNWNQQDFKNFRNTSQSHYKPKEWAGEVLRKYNITKTTFAGFELTSNQVRCMLASLLTKLFTAFDPIGISNKMSENAQTSFQSNLVHVLNDYYEITPFIFNKLDRKTDPHYLYRDYFDNIKSLAEIKKYIGLLSKTLEKDIDKIEKSAKASGGKIYENIFYDFYATYPQTVTKLLTRLINEYSDYEIEAENLLQLAMLNEICEDNYTNIDSIKTGSFQMSYLHLAALAGNTNYVKFILENQLLDKNLKAAFDILPLHCAIYYYIKHDEDYDFVEKYENDLELIASLADDKNLLSKIANQQSALYLLLTKLSEPGTIIKHLYNKGKIGGLITDYLLLYTTMLEEQNIEFKEFNNPLIHIIDYIENDVHAAFLVKLFVLLGADNNSNPRKERFVEDYELDLPVFFAIRRDNHLMVEALYKDEDDFRDIYDHNGYPPILSALFGRASLDLLKALFDCDADLADENLHEVEIYPFKKTCAFAEIIHPRSPYRNLDFLQYIVDNSESELIFDLLKIYCENDEASTDDDESLWLLEIVIKEIDRDVLTILFLNKDGTENEIMAKLREGVNDYFPTKILKLLNLAQSSTNKYAFFTQNDSEEIKEESEENLSFEF